MARIPVWDVSCQGCLFEMYFYKYTCLGCIMSRIPVWDMYHDKDTCLGCIMSRIPVWDVS